VAARTLPRQIGVNSSQHALVSVDGAVVRVATLVLVVKVCGELLPLSLLSKVAGEQEKPGLETMVEVKAVESDGPLSRCLPGPTRLMPRSPACCQRLSECYRSTRRQIERSHGVNHPYESGLAELSTRHFRDSLAWAMRERTIAPAMAISRLTLSRPPQGRRSGRRATRLPPQRRPAG
jgi:hypothetical protein